MVLVCLPSDALSQHPPSHLGFSYLGCGVSLHDAQAKCSLCSLPWMRGIFSQPPLKNEGMEPKKKQYPVVDGTGDRSKVQCCKEQYCIGTWKVRSMNQGKLEVAKQEMTRVNVNILGISDIKWTGMGEFNSDDHYIYYYGQESLRRNGVAIIVNKRVRNAVLGCNLKNDRMISVHFQGKPFNITVSQAYAPTCNTEEAKVERFYEDLQDLLELTPKKDVLFIRGDWNAKVGSQEIPGINGEIWPWSRK